MMISQPQCELNAKHSALGAACYVANCYVLIYCDQVDGNSQSRNPTDILPIYAIA